MTGRSDLVNAYRKARYRVFWGDQVIELRVGEPQPALQRLLRDFDAGVWAIITAHNPHSHRLSPEDNAARQAALVQRVAAMGYPALPSVNVDPDPDPARRWPDEPGLFIAGMPYREALALARAFGQNGILAGHQEGAPELLLLADPD